MPKFFYLFAIVAAGLAASCDGESNTSATTPDTVSDAPSSTLTSWSPSTSTSAVPTYGKSCRFGAETIFESPSNGATDDSLILIADSSGADLTVAIFDGTTTVASATIRLERGLADKSWRNGTGVVTWSDGSTSPVVDAALCVSERLSAGVEAVGELTWVVETGNGGYESASGSFTIPGAQVLPSSGETLASDQLDIDLR